MENENRIFEECSEEAWTTVGKEAALIIDVGCPLKLQEIQIINGVKDFSTKRFSVLGGEQNNGPWSFLFTGELEQVISQVRKMKTS